MLLLQSACYTVMNEFVPDTTGTGRVVVGVNLVVVFGKGAVVVLAASIVVGAVVDFSRFQLFRSITHLKTGILIFLENRKLGILNLLEIRMRKGKIVITWK